MGKRDACQEIHGPVLGKHKEPHFKLHACKVFPHSRGGCLTSGEILSADFPRPCPERHATKQSHPTELHERLSGLKVTVLKIVRYTAPARKGVRWRILAGP